MIYNVSFHAFLVDATAGNANELAVLGNWDGGGGATWDAWITSRNDSGATVPNVVPGAYYSYQFSFIGTGSDTVTFANLGVGHWYVDDIVVFGPPTPAIANAVLSNGKVTLTGTTAEANDSISVYDGSKLLGTVTTDSSGNWDFVTRKVSNTIHLYTVSETDLTGNNGPSINEAILGSTKDDVLVGTLGDDIIIGNGGNDKFTGGAGADKLVGGPGRDTFVFTAITDSTPASHDMIVNFNHDKDTIEFTNISSRRQQWKPDIRGKIGRFRQPNFKST